MTSNEIYTYKMNQEEQAKALTIDKILKALNDNNDTHFTEINFLPSNRSAKITIQTKYINGQGYILTITTFDTKPKYQVVKAIEDKFKYLQLILTQLNFFEKYPQCKMEDIIFKEDIIYALTKNLQMIKYNVNSNDCFCDTIDTTIRSLFINKRYLNIDQCLAYLNLDSIKEYKSRKYTKSQWEELLIRAKEDLLIYKK